MIYRPAGLDGERRVQSEHYHRQAVFDLCPGLACRRLSCASWMDGGAVAGLHYPKWGDRDSYSAVVGGV